MGGTSLTVGIPNPVLPPSDNNGPTGQVNTSAPGSSPGPGSPQRHQGGVHLRQLDGSASRGAAGADAGAGSTIAAAEHRPTAAGADADAGAGATAFNVQNIGGILYVTYANPNNPLGGYVDEYNTNGQLITSLISDPAGTHLHRRPGGGDRAPSSWGQFGGDLLVGNNDGDGTINAYTTSGTWVGQITLGNGQVFSQGELWGITFGNGGSAGAKNILYFDAGLPGATNGLFGALSSVPEPSSAVLAPIAAGSPVCGGGAGRIAGASHRPDRRRPYQTAEGAIVYGRIILYPGRG